MIEVLIVMKMKSTPRTDKPVQHSALQKSDSSDRGGTNCKYHLFYFDEDVVFLLRNNCSLVFIV